MALPPLIRDAFELLACEEEDALVQLAAIRTLRGWLGARERAGLAVARAQDYTWEEIGRAQGRPRQAVSALRTRGSVMTSRSIPLLPWCRTRSMPG